jgi:hypothetical protein
LGDECVPGNLADYIEKERQAVQIAGKGVQRSQYLPTEILREAAF